MFSAIQRIWRRGHADENKEMLGVAAWSAPIAHRDRLAGEEGQTMAEYAVVLTVVTLLVASAFSLLGTTVAAEISRIAGYIKF